MRVTILALLIATSPAAAADPAYSWKTLPGDADRIYLYENGRQVGGWCYRTQKYRTYDGTTWGEPTDRAPTKPPANRVVITPAAPPAMLAAPPPATAMRPLRGPLRKRAANIFADAMVEGTMRIFEELPGAIANSMLDSIFKRK